MVRFHNGRDDSGRVVRNSYLGITAGLPVLREASVRPKLPRHELRARIYKVKASRKTATDFQSTARSLLRFPCVVLFAVDIGMVF